MTNPLGAFNYSYDPASARLTQVSYPNGQQAQFEYYDPLNSGRLKTITNLGAGATAGQVLSKFDYDYNPAGEITEWVKQLGNSASDIQTLVLGYDEASQLTGAEETFSNGNPAKTSTFGYDASGNRTLEKLQVGSGLEGSFTNTFSTNNLNQLTNITPNPHKVEVTASRGAGVTVNGEGALPDGEGVYEETLEVEPGGSTGMTITAVGADGQVAEEVKEIRNTQPYEYDANGNLTRDDTRSYEWDAANRLIRVSWLNPTPPGTADTVQFKYDGLGRRVKVTEARGSEELTDKSFVWCGAIIWEERSSTGEVVVKRYYGQGFKNIGGPEAGDYFYSRDHLGSIREVTDASGVIQAKFDYDAWGRRTRLAGALKVDMGYTGFYRNEASGLDLTWFRAYDADKGRWLSRDPIGEIAGCNMYAYVRNNIFSSMDPFGLAQEASSEDLLLGGLLIGALGLVTVVAAAATIATGGLALGPIVSLAAGAIALANGAVNVREGLKGHYTEPSNIVEDWLGGGVGAVCDLVFNSNDVAELVKGVSKPPIKALGGLTSAAGLIGTYSQKRLEGAFDGNAVPNGNRWIAVPQYY